MVDQEQGYGLPHGQSFLFVDEVVQVEDDQLEGLWKLKGDEFFLSGHFPGQPIMPGVLMIESLAQFGGILGQMKRGDNPLKEVRLTAVRQFKIFGTILPGQSLRLKVKLDGMMGAMMQVSGEIKCEETGQMVASGSIVLSGQEMN
jgi:3-hydroxymyristoyl/3-hydroxydecanoyl-(acyl carrier protein) dehydratase